MAGGSFTANLNSSGLKLNVKNYKLKNNNINLDLYDADSSYENIDYTTSEENINTNDFELGQSISKASNQLQEIKSTQEEEKPWWDVVFDYAATAVGSVVSGVADVVENIGDGLIMCGGELASGVASLCGNEDLASEIKKGTQDIVQYDWSESAYDAAMEALDVDDEIAHGAVHQVVNALGSMAGYAALSLVPGGAAVTAATGFLAAKGSSAEHAFQSGATFEEASVTSTVAGVAGAASGAALNKVQGAAKGASSLKDVAKLTAKGMAVSSAEPVVNSVTEYATYGKDMVDENGNPLYDNFGDYYVESGGLLNTAIASGIGGISTGSQAIKGYKDNVGPFNNINEQEQLKNFNQNLSLDDFDYEETGVVSSVVNRLESNLKKYVYTNTNEFSGLNDKIVNDGLYHFTDSADDILKSGYIKSSGMISSYGKKKSFFFAGVPEVGAYATNLDDIPIKTTAIKVNPDSDLVNSSMFKVRNLDDYAITYDGNFNLSGSKASKEYFCLVKEADSLAYKKVSKEFYDNYETTKSGQQLSEFLKRKSNVQTIKNDYYYQLANKNTNAVSELFVKSELNKLNDSITKLSKPIDVYKSYDHFIDAYNDFGKMDLDLSWDFALSGKSVNEYINDDSIDIVKRQALQKFCDTTEAGQTLSKLTSNELESCRIYSGEAYGPINTYLRKGSTTIASESYIKNIINDIDSAMKKADPLQNDMILYRGVDFEKVFSSYIKEGDINSLTGQTIPDKAYMSTSVAKDTVRDYNTVITIKTPKGTKALNMFSINGNQETEFLLDKNCKLFIENVEEVMVDGKKQYNIVASLNN